MIIFNILKQHFSISNIFQRKKFVKSMSQAPNLGRLLSRSNFKSQHKNHEVKHCGKDWVSYHYLLKASLYQFEWVNKTILLKNSFGNESSNLIYVVILPGCKEEHKRETGCVVKERISIYRQYIRQQQYKQLADEEHLPTCRDGKIHMLPFFKIALENKSLRKSYEDYFIDKCKPLLKKKT